MKSPLFSWCLGFALASGIMVADEKLPSTAEAIEEVRAAYAKNDGYIVVYESRGENKSLGYTVGVDGISGLTASRLVATKGERKMMSHFWNTDDDRLYFRVGGGLFITRGLREEMDSLSKLVEAVTPMKIPPPQAVQYLLLNKDSLGSVVGFCKSGRLPLESHLDGSTISAADEESIAFETKEDGTLTFSRKTGMMIRQSIQGTAGEDRVLELKEFKRNPGRKAIEEMSRDWSTLGAKEKNVVSHTAAIRLQLFQVIIESVEDGTTDLGKLEESLTERKDSTRHFVECFVAGRMGLPGMAKWKELPIPDTEKTREYWLKKVPGANAEDEASFKNIINSPEFRASFRDEMVDLFLNMDGARDALTSLLFEDVWKQLRTQDETGRAAKDLLGKSISRAFLELVIDRRMNQVWGDPRGLD